MGERKAISKMEGIDGVLEQCNKPYMDPPTASLKHCEA